MNSDTTRAFLAGALLPSIAFYFWNVRNNNRRLLQAKHEEEEEEHSGNDDDDDEDEDDSDDDYDDDENEMAPVSGETLAAVSQWGLRHAPYKMLLVVNMELTGMGKGKMAAQCCHAAVGCVKRASKRCPAALAAWERTGCAKIAVKCPTTRELQVIAAMAQSKGIPFYLVEDAGRTQIAAGSRTVVGLFGPVSVFEGFTDHLKLM